MYKRYIMKAIKFKLYSWTQTRREYTENHTMFWAEGKNIVSPSVQFSSVQSLSRVRLFVTP